MRKPECIGSFIYFAAALQFVASTFVMAGSNIELINKLDLDKDGQITIKEAVADPIVLAAFGKLDTNGDGKISAVELAHTKITLIEDKKISRSE